MSFGQSISCRLKLRLISALLALSTAIAGLTVLVHFTPFVTMVLWAFALVGGFSAVVLLNVAGGYMAGSVEQLARRASGMAAGDLTGAPISICSRDEIGDLARSMAELQQNLARTMNGVFGISSSLDADAHKLSEAGAAAWSRTNQQSQQTHQAASAMQEMSITIAEVSGNAQSASDSAREASTIAHEGGAIVDEVLSGMKTISDSVAHSAATVERLGHESEQIIRIVNVIEEIAEKTNLLALNAAIEAARAGEQGRGFAVVAGEVRRLAESTRSATTEIGQMIESITKNTREAVQAMSSGTERVGKGMEIAARAGDSLKRIIAASDQVEAMIAQIATASTEQSVAAQEFSQNLEVINRLGEEGAAATPITKACVESIRSDAGRLVEATSHFRLGDSRSTAVRPATPRSPASEPVSACGD